MNSGRNAKQTDDQNRLFVIREHKYISFVKRNSFGSFDFFNIFILFLSGVYKFLQCQAMNSPI